MTALTVAAPVQRATRADTPALACLLAEAFTLADPIAGWLVPDVGHRQAVFIDYFTNVLEHALTVGQVDTTATRSAVAIWYPHLSPPPLPADIDLHLPEPIGGPYAARFGQLDLTIANHNPLWTNDQLGWMAVDPAHRCAGLGTALLRHHHDSLNQLDVPAWLMATTAQARDWLHGRGYQLHTPKGPPFALPDGPPLFKMWREPCPPVAGPSTSDRYAPRADNLPGRRQTPAPVGRRAVGQR